MDGDDGATKVLHVEGDGHVDKGGVTDGGENEGGAFTVGGIAEWSSGAEGGRGGCRDGGRSGWLRRGGRIEGKGRGE